MGAALDCMLEEHPSLLPRDEGANKNGKMPRQLLRQLTRSTSPPLPVPPLCRSSASSKRVFNSLSGLSYLLTASLGELSSLLVEALSVLPPPPHRPPLPPGTGSRAACHRPPLWQGQSGAAEADSSGKGVG